MSPDQLIGRLSVCVDWQLRPLDSNGLSLAVRRGQHIKAKTFLETPGITVHTGPSAKRTYSGSPLQEDSFLFVRV